MIDTVWFLLAGLIIFGVLYFYLSIMEHKVSPIKKIQPFFKAKVLTTSLFVLGIIIHTIGDLTTIEMELETVGHFIIMIGAVILIIQTRRLISMVEEYGI